MTKFRAQTIADLRTAAADAGRAVRFLTGNVAFAVQVEADDGSWFELDADDLAHAKRLAINIVDVQSARGASVWSFDRATGKCARKPAFTHYAALCGAE